MRRAVALIPAAAPHDGRAIDAVLLDYAARQAPPPTLRGLNGTTVDMQAAARWQLRHDDRLVLDDGTFVEVVARPEPLAEIRAAGLSALAHLAWQIGDRHIPAELHARRLRIRRDAATEAWLVSLGASIGVIEAPFEPERGAYAAHVR